MNIPKITKRFETSLASGLSDVGTTFTTVSATDDDGNALSGRYALSIDVGNADVEDVIATVSGTTWTIEYRGIDADAPNTEVSANKKTHRRGAPVVITDYPIMGVLRNILNGDATLPNVLQYASGVGPLNADDLVDKGYADALAIAGAGLASTGTAGLVEEATQAEIDADTGTGSVARLAVNPSTLATSKYGTRLPSSDQKAALAGGGNFGTPSTSNKFLTQDYNASASGIAVTKVYTNIFGSSTTQFDITNPGGTTFRYTFDGTGTDPLISSTTVPIGTTLVIAGQNFNVANNGTFVVTGVGANFFEVTNASGVAENNKTLGSGTIKYGYSKPTGLKYIIAEVQGGGGGGGGGTTGSIGSGGGGGGGYSRELIAASSLGATETMTIGAGGTAGAAAGGTGGTGGTSSLGSLLSATGGAGGAEAENGGAAGAGANGDLNLEGSDGSQGQRVPSGDACGGNGGNSRLGGGGKGCSSVVGSSPALPGNNYGGGGGGAGGDGNDNAGGAGAQGVVVITEYYS